MTPVAQVLELARELLRTTHSSSLGHLELGDLCLERLELGREPANLGLPGERPSRRAAAARERPAAIQHLPLTNSE